MSSNNYKKKRPIDVKNGRILAEFRKANGKTQKEYADILGIPKSTYRKYEYGISRINYEMMLRIKDKLGLDLLPLIDDRYDRKPKLNSVLLELTSDEKLDLIIDLLLIKSRR